MENKTLDSGLFNPDGADNYHDPVLITMIISMMISMIMTVIRPGDLTLGLAFQLYPSYDEEHIVTMLLSNSSQNSRHRIHCHHRRHRHRRHLRFATGEMFTLLWWMSSPYFSWSIIIVIITLSQVLMINKVVQCSTLWTGHLLDHWDQPIHIQLQSEWWPRRLRIGNCLANHQKLWWLSENHNDDYW